MRGRAGLFPALAGFCLVTLGAVHFASVRAETGLSSAAGGDDTLRSRRRAATFRAQALQTDQDREWWPWFRNVPALDAMGPRCAPELCFLPELQVALWNDKALQRLRTLPPADEDGPERGIVPTILGFAEELERKGIDLLVVPVPPRSAVYPAFWDPENTPIGAREKPPLLDLALRRLYADLENSGVEIIDVLPAFLERRFVSLDREGRPHEELLFRRQDHHWSPAGADLAARVVADRLRRFPWFSDAVRSMGEPRLRIAVEWSSNPGNIVVRLATRGRLPPFITEPELSPTRVVRIEGEEWTLDDRDSPVLVLGDSFTRRRHGFPDALLLHTGFRMDRVTVPGGLAPTQLQALRLRGGGLEGKRVVVWVLDAASFLHAGRWFPVPLSD